MTSAAAYLSEFRAHARPLAAASLGTGTSLPLFAYTNSVFAPHLVSEFGWSRAQFALVGLMMLTTVLVLPFVGRFTDRLGVRRIAVIGAVLVPLCFVGYALQNGSFAWFLVASGAVMAVGSTTSPLVYTRLIAENFARATGLALTVMNCVPALLAIALVPVIEIWIGEWGWRSAYLALGALTLVTGLGAVWLTPSSRPKTAAIVHPGDNMPDYPAVPAEAVPGAVPDPKASRDYRTILGSRVFWIIFFGMFLCILQTPLHASQMNLMLVDNRISTATASMIVSVYAVGTIVGRIGCGLALDRFPTPIVTTLSMVLPALGFFLLATDMNTVPVIASAMFLVGLSVGAESDLISYLVARYFAIRIYNTTLGLVFVVSFLASAIGALAISRTLAIYDSFSPFLYFVSGSILVGCMLFLLLPWSREGLKVGETHEENAV